MSYKRFYINHIDNDDTEAILELLNSGDDNPNYNKCRIVRYAADEKKWDIVRLFLNHESIDIFKDTDFIVLTVAGYNAQWDIVKHIILDPRFDISKHSVVAFATSNEDLGMLNYLLELGADPSIEDSIAFFFAVEHNFIEGVKVLLNYDNIDFTNEANNVIELADEMDNIDMLKLLLTKDVLLEECQENYNYIYQRVFKNKIKEF